MPAAIVSSTKHDATEHASPPPQRAVFCTTIPYLLGTDGQRHFVRCRHCTVKCNRVGCIALGERSFFDALTQLQLTAASTELPFAASVLCHSAPTHTAAQVQGWFEALAPLCYRLGVARPVVVSIHFGGSLPATIARLHVSGIVFAVTVTNCAEGAVCRTAEIDSHVAQGSEAGGHRGASTHAAQTPQTALRRSWNNSYVSMTTPSSQPALRPSYWARRFSAAQKPAPGPRTVQPCWAMQRPW